MKNAFYLMLKALFVLEIFTLFGYVEKRLDNKADVNYKIYDVTDWATNNYNIFLNIWRSKGNQKWKFGGLTH